jgi:hypothetical protein
LHENIPYVAILIHRAPEVMAFPMDGEEHFVQVPPVARPGPSMPELIHIRSAELAAPLPDGFKVKIIPRANGSSSTSR